MDKKFLACLINTEEEAAGHNDAESMRSYVLIVCAYPTRLFYIFIFFIKQLENLLVLVDQHAAHERVRLESLIAGKK